MPPAASADFIGSTNRTSPKTIVRQEQFSLLFRVPTDSALPQYLYRIEHEHLGAMDLLLVPVGIDREGRQYEAVFNLLR